MVSYGLAYGMEAYGLGQRLNIPTGEAQEILDAYFVAFPSVKAFMERTVAEARERGYTETVFGRRRQIPELSSGQRNDPHGGGAPGHERPHPGPGRRHLQGGAGAPGRRPWSRRGLRQPAHPPGPRRGPGRGAARRAGPGHRAVRFAMSGAFDLRVPLEVNLSHGASWAAAKG